MQLRDLHPLTEMAPKRAGKAKAGPKSQAARRRPSPALSGVDAPVTPIRPNRRDETDKAEDTIQSIQQNFNLHQT